MEGECVLFVKAAQIWNKTITLAATVSVCLLRFSLSLSKISLCFSLTKIFLCLFAYAKFWVCQKEKGIEILDLETKQIQTNFYNSLFIGIFAFSLQNTTFILFIIFHKKNYFLLKMYSFSCYAKFRWFEFRNSHGSVRTTKIKLKHYRQNIFLRW